MPVSALFEKLENKDPRALQIPKLMHAVVLTGHGGLDKLEYRTDIPTPQPKPRELLIRTAAAPISIPALAGIPRPSKMRPILVVQRVLTRSITTMPVGQAHH